ncbi:hypothetical protein HDU76_012636 [Blyttiomyces sp. JEL0837]|nr:hypothetical protein HDU76_012636 [Blyttiomyces sp. JEL0837]
MTTSSLTLTNVAAGCAVFAIGYLIYFDQRRQRDPAFRKRLRKDRLAAAKAYAEDEKRAMDNVNATVKAAMDAMGIDDDKIPTTEEERRIYLQRQLQLGEQFLNKGPSHYQAAATCLHRALRVYPDPLKLLMAFQETVPAPVLEIVLALMATEPAEKPVAPVGATVQELD